MGNLNDCCGVRGVLDEGKKTEPILKDDSDVTRFWMSLGVFRNLNCQEKNRNSRETDGSHGM